MALVDVFGQPTANTTADYEITATSTYGTYYPYLGFGSGSDRIWGNNGWAPAYLRYKFLNGVAYIIKSLSFTPYAIVTGGYLQSTAFEFQGSNDDFQTYDVLYTFSSSSQNRVTVDLSSNVNAYSDYRFQITSSGGYCGLMEIQAQGELPAASYTVRFNDGDGNTATQNIEVGVATALNSPFTKSGYTLKGWDTAQAGTTVVYTPGQTVTDIAASGVTLDLYAVWEKTWGYLIKDGSENYYTATKSGATQTLSRLTGISTLNKAVFTAHGFQFRPNSAVLKTLTNPTVYLWQDDAQPGLSAAVDAVPYPQEIKTQIDFNRASVTGIDSIEATYSGNIKVQFSYNDSSYTTAVSMASFLAMDVDALYNGLTSSKQLYIKFILQDANARLTQFILSYKRSA